MDKTEGTGLTLGLDLDGVCVDYLGALRTVVADHRGIDPAELPEPTLWNLSEWGLTRETFVVHHREAVHNYRVFRNATPIPGALEAVRRLNDSGINIRVITHRCNDGVDKRLVISDTLSWMSRQDLPYHEACFVQDKTTVAADLYIDDAPHVIRPLVLAGAPLLIFDQPYNRDELGERVHGWTEAEASIREAMSRLTSSSYPNGLSHEEAEWAQAAPAGR